MNRDPRPYDTAVSPPLTHDEPPTTTDPHEGEWGAQLPVLKPVPIRDVAHDTRHVYMGTVKIRAQATRGTSNSGWVFGMVVLSNSVEAEISQLDY